MENEDPYHRQVPWPPRSKVKVTMSHSASDRCWPISQERKVLEIPKLVGRLPYPTGNIAHLFQGQKVKGQGQQGNRKCILSTKREVLQTSKLVQRWSMLSAATASYKGLWSWVLARGRGHTVLLLLTEPSDHTTHYYYYYYYYCSLK